MMFSMKTATRYTVRTAIIGNDGKELTEPCETLREARGKLRSFKQFGCAARIVDEKTGQTIA